jgi:hypothetical protein
MRSVRPLLKSDSTRNRLVDAVLGHYVVDSFDVLDEFGAFADLAVEDASLKYRQVPPHSPCQSVAVRVGVRSRSRRYFRLAASVIVAAR